MIFKIFKLNRTFLAVFSIIEVMSIFFLLLFYLVVTNLAVKIIMKMQAIFLLILYSFADTFYCHFNHFKPPHLSGSVKDFLSMNTNTFKDLTVF
jgi:hypothetical protein